MKLRPDASFLLFIIALLISRIAYPLARLEPHMTSTARDSSLIDFSSNLDPPAGKHGFLTVTSDGHFAFEDGTPARFFGINVARDSVFQSKETIDRLVGLFSRAGINLVRFHHMDERDGLIDQTKNDTRHLREDRLSLLDYWISELKKHGIYIYLDLLDYRTFKPGDGVRNTTALERGGKPCSVFDPRLIELQKEFATQLLGRVNQITRLRYADDPAIAMVELFDENGLFRKTDWRSLPQPYAHELLLRWKAWIRSRQSRSRAKQSADKVVQSLPSLNDPHAEEAVRFADQIHRKYYQIMREHLRAMGVRIPLTSVGRFDELADVHSVARELDFVGINYYWDHPFWKKGRDWTLPAYFHDENPIESHDERSLAAQICRSRVSGKPLVIREWNYCWPNRFRSAGVVEAVSYASLHDIDGVILFDFRAKTERINYFDVSMDPSRWSLIAMLSNVFLQRHVTPSKNRIRVVLNDTERFRLGHQTSGIDTAFSSTVEHEFEFESNVGPARIGPAAVIRGDEGRVSRPTFSTDTGEIVRYSGEGYLDVTTSRFAARAGNLNARPCVLGPVAFEHLPDNGAVLACSLDHEALSRSSAIGVEIVTNEVNEGQTIVQQEGRWALLSPGLKLFNPTVKDPAGEPSVTEHSMQVSIRDSNTMRLFGRDSAIELVVFGKTWYLHSRTLGVRLEFERKPNRIISVALSGEKNELLARSKFTYPSNARYVELRF